MTKEDLIQDLLDYDPRLDEDELRQMSKKELNELIDKQIELEDYVTEMYPNGRDDDNECFD